VETRGTSRDWRRSRLYSNNTPHPPPTHYTTPHHPTSTSTHAPHGTWKVQQERKVEKERRGRARRAEFNDIADSFLTLADNTPEPTNGRNKVRGYSALSTQHSVLCALHSALCTLHSALSRAHSLCSTVLHSSLLHYVHIRHKYCSPPLPPSLSQAAREKMKKQKQQDPRNKMTQSYAMPMRSRNSKAKSGYLHEG
jgi:hypothetical protein